MRVGDDRLACCKQTRTKGSMMLDWKTFGLTAAVLFCLPLQGCEAKDLANAATCLRASPEAEREATTCVPATGADVAPGHKFHLLAAAPRAIQLKRGAMTQVTVENADTLMSALRAAHGGDVIVLAPGNYGEVVLRNLQFDTPVTIVSSRADDPAVLQRLVIGSSEGLTFRNLEIQVTPGARGIEVTKGSNVTLDRLDVHGSKGDGPLGDGVGLHIRNSDGVTVSNSEFSELSHGLAHLDSTHLVISDNRFHDIRIDGVRGGGSSQVEISRNYFTDFHRQAGDHGDAVQFWTSNTTTGVRDIVVKDNVFVRGEGDVAQGIFFGNEAKLPYENITITGNAIIGGMYNGISINTGHNVVISDNLVLGYTDMASKIRVDQSEDVIIRNNKTSHFVLQKNGDGITQIDNTITSSLPLGETNVLTKWIGARGGTASGLPAAVIETFTKPGPSVDGSGSGFGPGLGIELGPLNEGLAFTQGGNEEWLFA